MFRKILKAKLKFDGEVSTYNKTILGTPTSVDGKHWYMFDDGKQSREIDIDTLEIEEIQELKGVKNEED